MHKYNFQGESAIGIGFDMVCPVVYAKETFVILLKRKIMEIERYESPMAEIVGVQVEQTVLSSSFTGENISKWEDM